MKVTLSADPERAVVIPIVKTNQDGASDSDYSGVPSGLTFNSGDTEKTIVFSAAHDEEDEDEESVKLTFDTLPAGVSAGSITETVVSIIDDDGGRLGTNKEIVGDGEPDIAVSFEQASYTAREGGTVTVKVTLSAAPLVDFSLPMTATAGAGLTTGDYSGVPASLDFETGDTEKSFVITAVQDDEDESDEKLTLGFGTLLTGLTNGTNTESEVTIADSIHVSYGASSYEAYEGGAGALVAVELDSAAATQTVVPLTATGMKGATSADWSGVPADVTFAPGDTRKTFTLMAYDDSVEDDGETVELGFGTLPAGVATGNSIRRHGGADEHGGADLRDRRMVRYGGVRQHKLERLGADGSGPGVPHHAGTLPSLLEPQRQPVHIPGQGIPGLEHVHLPGHASRSQSRLPRPHPGVLNVFYTSDGGGGRRT